MNSPLTERALRNNRFGCEDDELKQKYNEAKILELLEEQKIVHTRTMSHSL